MHAGFLKLGFVDTPVTFILILTKIVDTDQNGFRVTEEGGEGEGE